MKKNVLKLFTMHLVIGFSIASHVLAVDIPNYGFEDPISGDNYLYPANWTFVTNSAFISYNLIDRFGGVDNTVDPPLPAFGKYMLALYQGGAADTSSYTGISNSIGNLAISEEFYMNAGEQVKLCWSFSSEPGNGNFVGAGILHPVGGGSDIEIFKSVVPSGHSGTFNSSNDWTVSSATCPEDGMYQIILTASNPTFIGNYGLVVDMQPNLPLSSVRLTSITLDPEDSDGATTNAPGAWSTNTGDPLSQVGVMVDRVFLNEGSNSYCLGEISIPLKYGINRFTLFGNYILPSNNFYGAILFFDGVATPPQATVFNSNPTISSFLTHEENTDIMGGANGGIFFDKAPGKSVYTAPDGTMVEIVDFAINSSCSNTDRISFNKIESDGNPDTIAQLILHVKAKPALVGDIDGDNEIGIEEAVNALQIISGSK